MVNKLVLNREIKFVNYLIKIKIMFEHYYILNKTHIDKPRTVPTKIKKINVN